MLIRSTVIPLFLLLLAYQSPQDSIRQHYQAAEAARVAGNLEAAESEYAAILGEGYQRLGRIHYAQGDYKSAVSVLEVAQKYRAASAEVLVDLAIAHFGAQQYEMALNASAKALAIAPGNAGAHQMLGKTYFMLGDVGKSITELEAALKLAPNDFDVAYTLGIAYLRNRQPAAAKQIYDSLIKALGNQPQLHLIIGRAYRQAGLLPEATEQFKRAIVLDARFPRAHYYLGITYLLDEGQSKLGEALEEFKIEVAANPDEFFANYYLGVVYNFQRQWDLAIVSLRKASTIQPENPDPYFQLGQAYQELNKHEQAIEVLKKSIALNPNLAHNKNQVTTAHHRLAQSLLKTGQTEAGRKELEIAADLKAQAFKLEQQTQTGTSGLGPGNLAEGTKELLDRPAARELDEKARQQMKEGEAYYKQVIGTAHNNVGLLRAERADFVGAAEQFALAAKWSPQQEGLDYNLGLAYYKSESYKRAVRPLEDELKAHPANLSARILLGMTWFRMENYARASEHLSGVIEQQPADQNIYYALASSLITQGNAAAADRVIEQMKTRASDAPQIHLLLAEKHYAGGVAQRALAELTEVANSNSKTLLAHYYAGLLYLKLNKRDEALREFEKELALNPNDTQAKYAAAEILLTRNDERGVALLREVAQARPENAAARLTLGKALLQRRDLTGAIDNLERASKLEPENAEMHFQLGQAYSAAGRKADAKSQIDLSKQLRSGKAK